ncbi:MAG: hypothetical protein O3A00_17690 [Planctomycetota bacterium]|nr:hypothetical protein [Planctomycetota bacterium]
MLPTETTLPADLRPTSLVPQVMRRIREKGLLSTIRRMSFLANELYWERRLGIDTADCIPREFLSEDPASIGYDPIGYRQLALALHHADLTAPTGTFIDYGCGQGRVLARASVLPFERIMGVELSSKLCDDANANIDRLSRRTTCKTIQVINENAKEFVVPDDTKNIFLFNPFTGHLLEGVVEQIRLSLERQPRDLTILYILPPKAVDIFSRQAWMNKTFQHAWSGLKLHVHHSLPSIL